MSWHRCGKNSSLTAAGGLAEKQIESVVFSGYYACDKRILSINAKSSVLSAWTGPLQEDGDSGSVYVSSLEQDRIIIDPSKGVFVPRWVAQPME